MDFPSCAINRHLAFLFLLWIPWIAAPDDRPAWKYREQQNLREMRKNIDPSTDLHLSVDTIASRDGQQVWLGGSYRTPAHSYRSLLLRSRDGGKSWSEIDEWMTGSEVCEIYILDEKHIWFITAWSVEGSQAPYYIFRSTDGGKTWRRMEKSMPSSIETSLSYVTDFFFETQLRGEITFISALGVMQTYLSLDGGATWRILTAQKIDPDQDLGASRSPRAGESASRPKYKADTDLENHVIFIQQYDPSTQEWKRIGFLPYRYELKENSLTPVVKRITPPKLEKP
ncbi:MAG: WD40/YVTN/BNR-like repeat-containing protein [bacterium]